MVIAPDCYPGNSGLNLCPGTEKNGKKMTPNSIIEKDDHIFILST